MTNLDRRGFVGLAAWATAGMTALGGRLCAVRPPTETAGDYRDPG